MACSLRVFVTSATKPKKTISGFWPQVELCRFWLCGLTPHCELNPESTGEGKAACEGRSASSGPEPATAWFLSNSVTKAEGAPGDEAGEVFRDKVREASAGHSTELELFN